MNRQDLTILAIAAVLIMGLALNIESLMVL